MAANPSADEFRRRCLKPDANRLGTWTARRLGRPAALRLTRVLIRGDVSAHQVTAAAALTACAALAAFGLGDVRAWFAGSWLLVAWYVLDHVDGQIARYRGTASLDGATLDYLMHHGLNLLLPFALGFGLARRYDELGWCLAGASWSFGGTLLTLRHDARYKSFVQRLKLLVGEVRAVGGGGARPEPARGPRATFAARWRWCVLKAYEQHVVIGALTMLSTLAWLYPAAEPALRYYVLVMALPAPLPALWLVLRSARNGEAEREFAAWFRLRSEARLELRDGWWHVIERENDAAAGDTPAATSNAACSQGLRDVLTPAASDS